MNDLAGTDLWTLADFLLTLTFLHSRRTADRGKPDSALPSV